MGNSLISVSLKNNFKFGQDPDHSAQEPNPGIQEPDNSRVSSTVHDIFVYGHGHTYFYLCRGIFIVFKNNFKVCQVPDHPGQEPDQGG